jgi:hypothetical protein
MNPVDTATPSVGTLESSAPATAATTQTSSNPTVSASAPAVTKELAEMQASTQTAAAAATPTSTLQKVVEALVSVVQALVGVVTALISGGKATATGVSQGNATSQANTNGSSSSGGSTGSSVAGSTAGSSQGQAPGSSTVGSGSSVGSQVTGASQDTRSVFDVMRNDIGEISVRTLDGYLIRAEGRDEAWTITGPDGKTTRIWGDPHVKESDGKRWDFLNRSTFQFGTNKATVEVVPAGNGTTLTSRITIYSGTERVTIDGIDKNKPVVTAVSKDGRQHDDGLADGITYRRSATSSGEAWTSNLTGKVM